MNLLGIYTVGVAWFLCRRLLLDIIIIIVVAWSRTVAPLRDLWQPQQTIALTGGFRHLRELDPPRHTHSSNKLSIVMALSTTFRQCAAEATIFGKITLNKAISPFKVI